MGAFEFYLAFYGLLLGLSVAEVASGLLDAIGDRERIRLGRLTPLLAAFVFLDITSFWIYFWGIREHVTVDWATMFGGLVVALTYYLAAGLVFPRDVRDIGQYVSTPNHLRIGIPSRLLSDASWLGIAFVRRVSTTKSQFGQTGGSVLGRKASLETKYALTHKFPRRKPWSQSIGTSAIAVACVITTRQIVF